PVNWNHRSVVEIKGESKEGSWFLHAHTADEWLLKFHFRVPKRTFSQDDLRRRFDFPPLRDIDELPVYDDRQRVQVKNRKGPWQEAIFMIHQAEEIDTDEFRRFLDEARAAFLGETHRPKLNPADLTPWKVLGRKWHLSRKGFPSGKKVYWDAAALDALFDLLCEAEPNVEIDWTGQQSVSFQDPRDAARKLCATVHTKRRGGIDLTLFAPRGQITLGRIAAIGHAREITAHRNGREAVKIRFRTVEQIQAPGLREIVTELAQKS
ncbi:MAG: excinuclease ABC subunit UvrA, partial [Planctomycetaceae bacterium]